MEKGSKKSINCKECKKTRELSLKHFSRIQRGKKPNICKSCIHLGKKLSEAHKLALRVPHKPAKFYHHTSFSEDRKKRWSKMAKEKGFGKWMTGKKASESSKEKQRERMLGNRYALGTKQSKKTIEKRVSQFRGDKNWNWKGGISPIQNKIRSSIEYKLWVQSVFARDGYTCQKTGQVGGKLVAHHILNFSSHIELRFAIDNGITLSKEAHEAFHKIYGKHKNTREQLLEFLNNKKNG